MGSSLWQTAPTSQRLDARLEVAVNALINAPAYDVPMNSIGRPRPLGGIGVASAPSPLRAEVRGYPLSRTAAQVRQAARIGFVLAAVAVMFAACGRPSQPGVASLGSSTTTTVPSSRSQNAQFAIFGSCMRSHGEPQFQNPIASGKTVTFQVTPSLGIGTPRYAQAAAACRRYLPPGPPPPGMQQITQADEARLLEGRRMHTYSRLSERPRSDVHWRQRSHQRAKHR